MTLRADLSGKHAFVTGASSGLGKHFARVLAGCGARLTVAARRTDLLRDLVDELSKDRQPAHSVHLDVTCSESVRKAVAESIHVGGPLHILVNNAGLVSVGAALDHTEEQWDRVLDTNLKGSFLMATEVARAMRAAQVGGSIVNIASILGLRQGSAVASYAASKAGLVQLTKVLALELARFSIRVNAIAPGYIDTELNHDFWSRDSGKALIQRIPQRRLGATADLDGPLMLLASDSSAYMTGAVIAVDGGHLVSEL